LRKFLPVKGVYFMISRLSNVPREISEAVGEQLGVHHHIHNNLQL